MGSICSKPGTHSGGDIVLTPTVAKATKKGGQQLGDPTSQRIDPRIAAAEAAERRQKAAQTRGTSASNPNRGRLAAQLEASKSANRVPEPKQEERLVWD